MKKIVIISILFSFPFLTGCFGVNSYFKAVKNDLVGHLNGNYYEDTEFALGPGTLSIAGFFASFDDDREAADFIRDVSLIQVGIYKRGSGNDVHSNFRMLKSIDRRMNKNGWRYLVKNCSKDEMSAVYINKNIEKGIRRMFVVNFDKDELVIVQLNGNLSRVIETAIQDKGIKI